jgi:negative regulator of sigma E activity
MSLTHTELVYLMAYVDGEVEDDELPEVEALLAKSEEARSIVAQHAAMGDWVRTSSATKAEAAGADKIADIVLHEIDKLGGGKVVSLEREKARIALNRQRTKEFGALAATAAVAAGIWLLPAKSASVAVVKPPAKSAPAPAPEPQAAPAPSAPGPAAENAVAAAGEPSESDPASAEGRTVDVQTVESPSHPFSIFYVHGAAGLNAQASSVVVWIAE